MQLNELYDYKNQLMMDLLTNTEIVKLLDDKCVSTKKPETFIYKQIYPFEYVPDIIEQGQTFICCDVDIQKTMSKTYLQPILYIWVFTHKNLLQLPGGGVRTDKICSEIAKTINGSRYYGLGELDLHSVKRFVPITDYQGRVMTFQTQEFNRSSPLNRPIPSNRKSG